MKLLEGKSKSERNKIIAAIALGVIALGSLGYMLFGDALFGPTPTQRTANSNHQTPGPKSSPGSKKPIDDPPNNLEAVVYDQYTPPAFGGGRNIFDIYVPPPTPPPTPPPAPTPSPTPPYEYDLRQVSPGNVYAKTGDFTIQATGDKFTPDARISFDNNDLPTKFISPQQLSAMVPAALIANDGNRQIMVHAPDGKRSPQATMNIMAPPLPNYLYVGLVGDKRYKDDIALMRDKNNTKDLFSIKLGETINEKNENRFKIVSISEREVVVMDKTLKIKHVLPYTTGTTSTGSTGGAYPNGGGDSRFPQQNQRGVTQGEIPGIPSNIPRYQPPQNNAADDEDDDDEKPAVRPAPTKRP